MLQNENVEYTHNLKGMPPAAFHDIEDPILRAKNRGAILANIFERYVTEDGYGNMSLQPKDFAMCTRDISAYLDRMPKRDRAPARRAMFDHLDQRGYGES